MHCGIKLLTKTLERRKSSTRPEKNDYPRARSRVHARVFFGPTRVDFFGVFLFVRFSDASFFEGDAVGMCVCALLCLCVRVWCVDYLWSNTDKIDERARERHTITIIFPGVRGAHAQSAFEQPVCVCVYAVCAWVLHIHHRLDRIFKKYSSSLWCATLRRNCWPTLF